jgi:hypothetical protein
VGRIVESRIQGRPTCQPSGRARTNPERPRPLRNASDPGTETWLSFLLEGYNLLGDKAATDRIEARIVEKFPDSSKAERIVTRNWESAHPFPRNGDHAAQQTWYRLNAAAEHDWYEHFHDTIRLWQEFNATAALDETTPEGLLSVARKFVEAYRGNPNAFYAGSPIEFDVADALIKKKALPLEIPAWLDEGFRRENNRPSRLLGLPRDEMTGEMKANADRQIDSMRIERARILLDYYDALGQPAKAAGIEDQLSGVNPTDDRLKPELYEVRAHAASMENRVLDALMYYRAARDLGGKQSRGGVTDAAELDRKIDLLYTELGGTHATFALFTNKTGRYRRITHALRAQGWGVNHKRVARLMRQDNLLAIRKRRFVPQTTNSEHDFDVAVNVARRLTPTAANQLWVADITYVRLGRVDVFLAVVMDAFSRKIVGWNVCV